MKKICKYLLLVAFALLIQNVTFAVTVPTIDAGGVYNQMQEKQLEQKYIEEKLIEPAVEQKQEEKNNTKIEVNVQKDVEKNGVIVNPKFKLNKINFEGNTVIKSAVLEGFANDIIGKDIYFEDLLNLALSVSRYYQSKGYITSYAYVPAQEIKKGVATISIIESPVTSLDITGNKWARTWYLKNIMMKRNGLREGTVFNANALQATLRELNNENYIKASTSVTREDDKTKLQLNVRDRFPLKLGFGWDDYGRRYTGEQRASFLLGLDNVTGFGDKIYGGAILSSGSTGALAGYSIPVSPYGTRVSFDYGYSNINLGGPYSAMNIKGHAQTIGVKVTHPLIKNAKTDLIVYTGIDFVSGSTDSEKFKQTLADYNLLVLRSGLRGITDDKYGRWIGNLGVDVGFPTSGNKKSECETNFVKITAGVTRVQRIWKRVIGIVRLNGQYSPNKLYAIEQMQMGGPYTLRGYQPAELIGDYGVTGTVEIRTPIPGFRKILPKKVKFIDDKVRLAVFYDFGWVKEHGGLYNYPQNFLQSVGFGTYINITDWVALQLGVGFPIGKKYYNESSGRFYFGVNTELDKLIPLRKTESI